MILNPRKYQAFNELFAEYLGCTKDEKGRFIFPDGSKMALNMHFHDRWDWIMMVVEKIAGYTSFEIGSGAYASIIDVNGAAEDDIVSDEEKTLLLNVYNACYQYLKRIKNEETDEK